MAAVFLAATAWLPGPLEGQVEAQTDESGEPSSGPTHPEAVRLYGEAREAFGSGEFARAAALLERAYALEHDPILMFNRARALGNAGEPCEAALSYRRFLEEEPDPTDPGAIAARLETLDVECAEREGRPLSPAGPTVVTPDRGADFLGSGLLLGVGLAGVGAASVVGAFALDRRGFADDPTTSMANAVEAGALADDLGLVANVAWPVAGTVTLVGLIWLIVVATEGVPDEASLDGEARLSF